MADKGLDVPKTAKDEGEAPKPEAIAEASAPASSPARVAPKPLAPLPAKPKTSPVVDAVLGVSALVVGFFVGKKIRS